MGIDSGNSLTALYHERWLMTGRKPGTIFVPMVSNQFFPRVPFAFHRHHCRRRGTGGAVPAQGGHGAKARGRGQGHDLGKHENGNAELRPEVKALTLLSWKGTATSLTGLRHHGWPG